MIAAIIVLVLLVLLLIGLIGLTVLTHRNVHPRGDPARLAFPRLKSTLHLFLCGVLFNVVTLIVGISYTASLDGTYYPGSRVVSHLSVTGSLLISLASCAFIVTTADLAAGVRRAALGSSVNPRKFLLTINILTSIAAVFWFAYFVVRQVQYTRASRGEDYDSDFAIVSFVFAVLGLAGFGLLLISAITVLVYAVRSRNAVRRKAAAGSADDHLKTAKRIVAIASVNIVIFAWTIVAAFLIGFGVGYYVSIWNIIDVVISQFGMFALLVVIYFIGKAEKGGLWTVDLEGLPLSVERSV
ncbi:hypothetical protein B0T14DRAFT_525305 [Immersiella caudata]|uniref:Uncharacterized protein n=1 Tax=Immersiella caudata TaxID=314043 RepID=A0AA39WL97_9PEZI|nr:hypothetical protein B0T14DRAFT_525305 [Immersiella caudata]